MHTVPVGALRMGATAPEQMMRRSHTAVNKKPKTPSLIAGQRFVGVATLPLHTVVHDAERPLLKRSKTISAWPSPRRGRDARSAKTSPSGFAFKPWATVVTRRAPRR